jgi:DamX protein
MASYWQKFGLTSDPFVEEGQDIEPFIPSRWQQQLDLLRHLSRSSNMVLLVTGVSGVGKSVFMDMLLENIDAGAGVCKVHGSNGVTPDVLQELVARHLGMPMTSAQEANFQSRFVQQIERMAQANDEFYLVIDAAHKLPKSSLALLVDIAEWQSGQMHPLHLVLFGGPQLDAMMAEITAQHLGEAMTHTVRLDPFSMDVTREYISYRLDQAGYQGEFPLTQQQLNHIFQVSNGIPAKINIIARQVLLDSEPQKNSKRKTSANSHERKSPLSFTNLAITGSLAVIAIILFMVFYFRAPDDSASLQPVPIHTEADTSLDTQQAVADNSDTQDLQSQADGLNGMVASNTTTPAQPTATTSDTDAQADTASAPTTVADDTTSAPAPTDAATTEQSTTDTTTAVNDNKPATNPNWIPLTPAQAKAANTASTTVQNNALADNTNKAPATLKSTPKTAAKKAAKPYHNSIGLSADEKHLMQLNGERYTLQVAAASNLAHLRQFIETTGLNGQVYYFRTLNAGNPWFVAVYGEYTNASAAKQAMGYLPTRLLVKEKPWPRSFASIQSAIKAGQ